MNGLHWDAQATERGWLHYRRPLMCHCVRAIAMSGYAQDRETGLGPKGASAAPKGIAQ